MRPLAGKLSSIVISSALVLTACSVTQDVRRVDNEPLPSEQGRPASSVVIDTILLEESPYKMSLAPLGSKLFVLLNDSRKIVAIDTVSHGSTPLETPCDSIWDIAVLPGSSHLGITCSDGFLHILDTSSDPKHISSLPIGSYPTSIVTNEHTNQAYILEEDANSNSIRVLDLATLDTLRVLELEDKVESIDVDLVQDTFLVGLQGGTHVEFDAQSFERTNTIDLGPDFDSIGFSSLLGIIVGVNASGGYLSVGRGSDPPEMHNHYDLLYPFDAIIDGDSIYVAIADDASVARLDSVTLRVLEKIEVGAFPRVLALDPDSGNIFVANAAQRSISVIGPPKPRIGDEPRAVPGESPRRVLDALHRLAETASPDDRWAVRKTVVPNQMYLQCSDVEAIPVGFEGPAEPLATAGGRTYFPLGDYSLFNQYVVSYVDGNAAIEATERAHEATTACSTPDDQLVTAPIQGDGFVFYSEGFVSAVTRSGRLVSYIGPIGSSSDFSVSDILDTIEAASERLSSVANEMESAITETTGAGEQ